MTAARANGWTRDQMAARAAKELRVGQPYDIQSVFRLVSGGPDDAPLIKLHRRRSPAEPPQLTGNPSTNNYV